MGRHRGPELHLVEDLVDTIAIRADSARYGRHAAPALEPPGTVTVAGLPIPGKGAASAALAGLNAEVGTVDDEVSVIQHSAGLATVAVDSVPQPPGAVARIAETLGRFIRLRGHRV